MLAKWQRCRPGENSVVKPGCRTVVPRAMAPGADLEADLEAGKEVDAGVMAADLADLAVSVVMVKVRLGLITLAVTMLVAPAVLLVVQRAATRR